MRILYACSPPGCCDNGMKCPPPCRLSRSGVDAGVAGRRRSDELVQLYARRSR